MKIHRFVMLLAVFGSGVIVGCSSSKVKSIQDSGSVRSPVTQAVAPSTLQAAATTQPIINPALPTLFIAGDSTAAFSRSDDAQGWAVPFANYFDRDKINVVNLARGGRSSRTYLTEGLWDTLLAKVKPNDIVIIQFGHNDATAIDSSQARGSLPGTGEETKDLVNQLTGEPETVHTFGHYMRRMISDTKSKGATPIVMSLTLHNSWKNGQISRGPGEYAKWVADLAKETNVQSVDLSGLEADTLQELGQKTTTKLYRGKTHFGPAMADLHARFVVAGLNRLSGKPVEPYLSDAGRATIAEYELTKRLKVKE